MALSLSGTARPRPTPRRSSGPARRGPRIARRSGSRAGSGSSTNASARQNRASAIGLRALGVGHVRRPLAVPHGGEQRGRRPRLDAPAAGLVGRRRRPEEVALRHREARAARRTPSGSSAGCRPAPAPACGPSPTNGRQSPEVMKAGIAGRAARSPAASARSAAARRPARTPMTTRTHLARDQVAVNTIRSAATPEARPAPTVVINANRATTIASNGGRCSTSAKGAGTSPRSGAVPRPGRADRQHPGGHRHEGQHPHADQRGATAGRWRRAPAASTGQP